jgi:predicted Fe-Mo cluster-binding NifX family protein
MRLAIPIQGDHVATVFDAADDLLMVEESSGVVKASSRLSFTRDTNIGKVVLLKEQDVDVLICGALSGFMRRMIEGAGIRVKPFIRGTVEDVIKAFCSGALDDRQFLMPGCCPGPFPIRRRRRLRCDLENGRWRKP